VKWLWTIAVILSVAGETFAADSQAERLKESEEHNNRGAQLAAKGRYLEAVDAFRSAIRVAPESVVSHFNLGLAYARLDQFIRAQKAFETAASIRPDNGNVWYHLGRALQSQEKNKEALEAYTMALRLKPGDPDVRYWLGIASWLERDWAQAAAQWEALIVENPDHPAVPKAWEELPRAFFNLGTLRHSRGELNEAVKAYKEALRLQPDFADALLNLGDVYRDLGKFKEAETSLVKASRMREGDVRVHLGLGGVYLQLDSLVLARDQYLKALDIADDSGEARHGLASLLVRMKDLEGARKVALQLLLKSPNEVRSHRVLAYVYEHNEEGIRYGKGYRAQEAAQAYLNAIRLTPDDASLFYNLGAIYGRQGEWLEAKKAFVQALSIDSTHVEVSKWLPLVEEKVSQIEQ
jgi:superkiller protein 3